LWGLIDNQLRHVVGGNPIMRKQSTNKPKDQEVYLFKPEALEVGDIILSTDPTSNESRVIRWLTGGDYSHAAICTRVGLLVEATFSSKGVGGVARANIMRVVADAPETLRLLRLQPGVPRRREIAEKAAARAEWMISREYWFDGVKGFLRSKIPTNEKQAFFCSHLVAQAYREAGLELLPGVPSEKTAPSAFQESTLLEDLTSESLTTELESVVRTYLPEAGEGPHQKIEIKMEQALLSDPKILKIAAKYERQPPPGYWDLVSILAKSGDRELDKIMAVALKDLAAAYRSAWKEYALDGNYLEALEKLLRTGAMNQGQARSDLRLSLHHRLIMRADIRDRKRDVKQNKIIFHNSAKLDTFRNRWKFSEEYLEFMTRQMKFLERKIRLLVSYAGR
jgi:hypothetical protein